MMPSWYCTLVLHPGTVMKKRQCRACSWTCSPPNTRQSRPARAASWSFLIVLPKLGNLQQLSSQQHTHSASC